MWLLNINHLLHFTNLMFIFHLLHFTTWCLTVKRCLQKVNIFPCGCDWLTVKCNNICVLCSISHFSISLLQWLFYYSIRCDNISILKTYLYCNIYLPNCRFCSISQISIFSLWLREVDCMVTGHFGLSMITQQYEIRS